ncbi:MAG: hypothetical protein ABIJ80_02905 [Patescibacteria group bacterium]
MSTQITTYTKNKTFALPKKGVGVVEKMKNKSWGARIAVILPIFFVVFLVVGVLFPAFKAYAIAPLVILGAIWTGIKIAAVVGVAYEFLIPGDGPLMKILKGPVSDLFEEIMGVFFHIANWLFGCAVTVLDSAIRFSLDRHTFDIEAIKIGFNTVLGVANLFFIFILLYIAIATILQLAGFDWKKTIAKLVVAALLINFSLFFTRVIIDVSNMFAVNFYNSMKYTGKGGEIAYGPSAIVGSSFQFKDIFNPPEEGATVTVDGRTIELTSFSRAMVFGGGAIFMTVASFVLLAGTFIFIKRAITFIFLMMLAPVAFIGMILPRAKQFADEWWKTLIDNALIAPVFLFMLYLVCTILQEGVGSLTSSASSSSFAAAMAGDLGNMGIILQFLVLIGLMWGALVISGKVCASATTGAMNFAKKVSGATAGRVMAGTAIAGRQIGGRGGKWLTQNKTIQRWADTEGGGVWSGVKRSAARGIKLGGDQAAKRSWDVRNIPVVGSALTDSLKNYAGIDASFDQKRGREVGGFTEGKKRWDEWVDAGKAHRAQVYGGEERAGAEKMAEEYKKKATTATDDKEKKRYEAIAREIMKPIVEKENKEKVEKRAEFKEAHLTAQEEVKDKEREIDPTTGTAKTRAQALVDIMNKYQDKADHATLPKEKEFFDDLVKELKKDATQIAQEEVKAKEREIDPTTGTAKTRAQALADVIREYTDKATSSTATYKEKELADDLARELGKELQKEKAGERKEARGAREDAALRAQEATERARATKTATNETKLTDINRPGSTIPDAVAATTVSGFSSEDISHLNDASLLTQQRTAQHLSARQITAFADRIDTDEKMLQDIKTALLVRTTADPTDLKAEGALRQLEKILGLTS